MIPAIPQAGAWTAALLEWFARNRRPMPWRDLPTPYRVWVSEVMLQQTQVVTVIPYFNRFIDRFPHVRALAAAPMDDVLKQWEGLGYYSRARNLHRAAGMIVRERKGRLPATYADWRSIPGVGAYTAAAIASIAGGESVPAVDGNVLRVFARCLGFDDDTSAARVREQLIARLQVTLDTGIPAGDFNQAVMELGALVCRPRGPVCAACPLAAICVACRDGRTGELPVRARAKPGPRYQVGTALLATPDALLLVQRPDQGLLGGLWDLPRSRRDGREPMLMTAVRAAREILGDAAPGRDAYRKEGRMPHVFSHFSETLHLFRAHLPHPPPRPLAPHAAWIRRDIVSALPLVTATRKILLRLCLADCSGEGLPGREVAGAWEDKRSASAQADPA